MSVNNILNSFKVLFNNSINIHRQCEIVCAFPYFIIDIFRLTAHHTNATVLCDVTLYQVGWDEKENLNSRRFIR